MSEHRQDTRVANIREFKWLLGHSVEKGRALDVGGFGVPGVQIAFGNMQSPPALIACEDFAVLLAVHIRGHRFAHGFFHFFGRRPNITQVHRLAVAIIAQRIGRHIEIHMAGQCISDHERRRSQIIGADQRMNAALEVTVAAEHRDGDQAVFFNGGADRLGKRTAIPNARGAAKTNQMEIQFFEIRSEPGCLEIIGYDLRAGREARLYPGLGF